MDAIAGFNIDVQAVDQLRFLFWGQNMFDAEKISLIRELGMELSTASGKRFGEARETLLTRLIEKKAGSIKALQSLARRGKLGPTKESDILDINQALFLIQQAARRAPK